MGIEATCTGCNGTFSVADKYAGKKARCPKCNGVLQIPLKSQSPPPVLDVAGKATQQGTITPRVEVSKNSGRLGRFQSKHARDLNIPVWIWLGLAAAVIFGGMGYAVWQSRRPEPTVQTSDSADDAINSPKSKNAKGDGKLKAASLPKMPEGKKLTPLIGKFSAKVVRVLAKDAKGKTIHQGTGFIIDKSGRVLTMYHHVQEAMEIQIILPAGGELKATGYSNIRKDLDLALLEIEPGLAKFPKPFKIISKTVPKPKGEALSLNYPASQKEARPAHSLGTVLKTPLTTELSEEQQAFVRKLGGATDHQWIELEMELAPGHAGGPLLDAEGRLLGICAWSTTDHMFALHASHFVQVLKEKYKKAIPISEGRKLSPRSDRFEIEKKVVVEEADAKETAIEEDTVEE